VRFGSSLLTLFVGRSVRLVALSSAALCLLTGCRSQQRANTYDDDEAYAVYSSILPDTNPLVVRESTTTYELCLRPLDDQSEKVLRPALDDYLKVNSKAWLLRPTSRSRQYTILREEELKSTFSSGTEGVQSEKAWKTFFQRHPSYQGWMEVSAVGFNADKTIAVVYVGYHCGEECGGGEFKALQKQDGKWQLLTGKGRWNHCSWRRRDQRAAEYMETKPS
jgi:hypothetical protein